MPGPIDHLTAVADDEARAADALEKEADELEARAGALRERAGAHRWRERGIREAIAKLSGDAPLTVHKRAATVNSEHMDSSHRIALAESRRKALGRRKTDFDKAAEAAGYTRNDLARAVGMSPALLSQARIQAGKPNSRKIRQEKARQIEKLTGWPADEKHWPGGFVQESEG